MALPSAVPTLSRAGFLRTPLEKVDWIFAYFLETMKSQSNETREFNVSFQEILQRVGNDRYQLQSEINSGLYGMLNRYFPNVDLRVEVNEIPNSGGLSIVISGRVTEVDGKEYGIAQSLEAQGTNFRRVMRANNEGAE